MRYEIHIDDVAFEDLYAIGRYVAERLLDNIQKAMASLETMPARGSYPPELQRLGIVDFREIFFKPYRIIYEIRAKSVFIHAVLDGRRDMQDLLQERLLR